jgi:hypothetical protein
MVGKARTPGYTPSMSDEAVKLKTGNDWSHWFAVLDKAGGNEFTHHALTKILSEQHGVGPWWRQMVAVEYERARGLREKHQTTAGYSVSVSKTVAVDVSELYAALADGRMRKKWFAWEGFKPSSQTKDKYFRGPGKDGWKLEINVYAKGAGKSQIAIQVSKLGSEAAVEAERAAWKKALEKLQTVLKTA